MGTGIGLVPFPPWVSSVKLGFRVSPELVTHYDRVFVGVLDEVENSGCFAT